MEKYVRNCPECNCILEYTNKYNKDIGEKIKQFVKNVRKKGKKYCD